MKVEWQIKKIGEICTLKSGTTVNKSLEETYGDIPYLKVADMNLSENDTEIVTSSRFLNQESLKENSIFPVGTTIFPKRGGAILTNKKRLTSVPICTDLNIMGVIPSNILLPKYLYFYFLNIDMRKLGSGSSIPQINNYDIEPLIISFPPLPEQKRIVAIADEAFEGIDRAIRNTEKNLSNARELFESYLNSIFTQKGDGWEEKKLGDVCQVKDGTHFSPKNSEDGKYMYITAKNIKPYYIDLTKITFISEEDHQKIYSRCPVKKGDVLYIKDGATAGIAAINNFEEEFSLLSSVAVFKTSSQILNTYLVHYANSNLGRKNFLGYIDGAAITRLTLTKLNNVFIPIAPLYAQQEIVTKLDELSAETQRLENIYRQKIAALKELKQSILQKAFTGELTADKGEK
ncbi:MULTISPECIES: restriction endonuclease subunit S [unclassified Dolichospermum]|uniref:restriction endonuclease subunit S n=1 Tax=unclassified Dolichospermum TaxID=2622029 RepID=UPI0014486182|nr:MULTISPECIES: restriction endonuclease subunit S [unclassified Dolichospermum]MTJ17647.1 restriction endonuclease subunit S [Dolichospermum sp. UHCC 0299]MTJ37528.1 restriction endonuclease subunit S [Dolichospermum sp. UHCC 0406]